MGGDGELTKPPCKNHLQAWTYAEYIEQSADCVITNHDSSRWWDGQSISVQ
jgi:hypothetical protein